MIDANRILVAGGVSEDGEVLKSAVLYDLQKGVWEPLPDMTVARSAFGLTKLSDSSVTAVGGSGSGESNAPLDTTESLSVDMTEWTTLGEEGYFNVQVSHYSLNNFFIRSDPRSASSPVFDNPRSKGLRSGLLTGRRFDHYNCTSEAKS